MGDRAAVGNTAPAGSRAGPQWNLTQRAQRERRGRSALAGGRGHPVAGRRRGELRSPRPRLASRPRGRGAGLGRVSSPPTRPATSQPPAARRLALPRWPQASLLVARAEPSDAQTPNSASSAQGRRAGEPTARSARNPDPPSASGPWPTERPARSSSLQRAPPREHRGCRGAPQPPPLPGTPRWPQASCLWPGWNRGTRAPKPHARCERAPSR